MKRVGKNAKDIFAATTGKGADRTKATRKAKGPGRPAEHDEPWSKVTVVLFDRQIVFLDRLSADIRLKTKTAISRAELIRSMIDAVEGAGIDLTTARSEEDLKTILSKKMSR